MTIYRLGQGLFSEHIRTQLQLATRQWLNKIAEGRVSSIKEINGRPAAFISFGSDNRGIIWLETLDQLKIDMRVKFKVVDISYDSFAGLRFRLELHRTKDTSAKVTAPNYNRLGPFYVIPGSVFKRPIDGLIPADLYDKQLEAIEDILVHYRGKKYCLVLPKGYYDRLVELRNNLIRTNCLSLRLVEPVGRATSWENSLAAWRLALGETPGRIIGTSWLPIIAGYEAGEEIVFSPADHLPIENRFVREAALVNLDFKLSGPPPLTDEEMNRLTTTIPAGQEIVGRVDHVSTLKGSGRPAVFINFGPHGGQTGMYRPKPGETFSHDDLISISVTEIYREHYGKACFNLDLTRKIVQPYTRDGQYFLIPDGEFPGAEKYRGYGVHNIFLSPFLTGWENGDKIDWAEFEPTDIFIDRFSRGFYLLVPKGFTQRVMRIQSDQTASLLAIYNGPSSGRRLLHLALPDHPDWKIGFALLPLDTNAPADGRIKLTLKDKHNDEKELVKTAADGLLEFTI